ncbi:MAG: UDP-3-O-(3-hydroxymyristoyl)glucosamine N-acyltransferase [candidate division NC10 bacterium]|nr:UDP-3-O-(3-hydroxymyristoyl)glucosamine N-acyltransferase [candidate division NC10 bacterium]MBI2458652.1 UDP-3-O-(3-hydroxymyristoyl)glucosamine N-acyltransferase [candidate division NC10 bacterium]
MRLGELAERLGCRLEGDGGLEIGGVRGLEDAGPQDLAFLAQERHLPRLAGSAAAAVILAEGWPPVDRPTLRTSNPYLAFARALSLFHPASVPSPGIHPTAVVSSDARVAASASVGPFSVLGPGAEVGADTIVEAQVAVGAGVRIGRGCRIFPQVTLRDGVVLGDRVTVHSGAVIGADGFGYARDGHRYVKIPQIGRVVIEDEVEIGANVTIDRATLGETRIGRGTKIDNLVQIGHNVRVGADTVIVAQVGISGSTRIGSRVTLAGQVGVVDHVDIGDDVIVGAQAGVTKDIPAGSVVLGSPAIPHGEFKRQLAVAARLPEMRKILRALEERLAALEARLTR